MVAMSSEKTGPRPTQVTVAAWVVVAASAALLIAVFEEMTRLRTIDMRAEITQVIDSSSAQQLGLTVETATEVLRWCLMISGVAGVAAGIFGIYVLQRHQGARIGLTVAAVPVVLMAPIAGSLPGMMVGAGAVMLWGRSARDWFAGRPAAAVPAGSLTRRASAPSYDARLQAPPTGPPLVLGNSDAPLPTAGWGTSQVVAAPAIGASRPRPVAVRLACLLTFFLAGVTGLGALVAIAGITMNSDAVVDMVRDSEGWDGRLNPDVILPSLLTMTAVILVWCVVAIVLAAFAWRRRTWAWAMLIGCTAMAGVFSVIGFLTSPVLLVYIAACGMVLGWLCRRPSREWFTRPEAGPPPPSGPPILPQ